MKKFRNKNVKNLPSRTGKLVRKDMRPKRVLNDRDWEEFRKTYEEHYPLDESLTERDKAYIKTHLVLLDNVRKAWYLHAMKTWTREDYEDYANFYAWMFGIGSKGD